MKKFILIIFLVLFSVFLMGLDPITSKYSSYRNKGLYVSPFSGLLITYSQDKAIRLINKDNSINSIFSTEAEPNDVICSDDEMYLISGEANGELEFFSLKNQQGFKINEISESILELASKKNMVAASTIFKKIYIYDYLKKKRIISYSTKNVIVSMDFINESTLAVGDSSGYLYLIKTSGSVSVIKVFNDSFVSVNYLNGNLYCVSENGKVIIMDSNGKTKDSKVIGEGISQTIASYDKNYLLFVTNQNSIKAYNTKNFSMNLNVKNIDFKIDSIVFSNNWQIIYLSDGYDVYTMQFPTGIVKDFYTNKAIIPEYVYWIDKYICIIDNNKKVNIFNFETNRIENVYNLDPKTVDYTVAGKTSIISVGSDGFIRIYDLLKGTKLKASFLSKDELQSVEIVQNQKYIAIGGKSGKLYALTYPDLRKIREINISEDNWITKIGFNYKGDLISVYSGDKKVSILNFPNLDIQSKKIFQYKNAIYSTSWAHTKNYIATGGYDGIFEVYDANYGGLYLRPALSTGQITNIQWSYDDRYLATSSADSNVYIWDSKEGSLERKLGNNDGKITSISWNLGSRYIVSASQKNLTRIWDIDKNNIIESMIFFSDGKYVFFKQNGDYFTNLALAEEKKYFTYTKKINDSLSIKRQSVIKLAEMQPPSIKADDVFNFNDKNNTVEIDFSDNTLVRTITIEDKTIEVNKKNYKFNFAIDIEKLDANYIRVIAYDENGNRAEKKINIEFNDIKLYVYANSAAWYDNNNQVIGHLMRGAIVNLIEISGDFYYIEYNGKKGYVKKYFLMRR